MNETGMWDRIRKLDGLTGERLTDRFIEGLPDTVVVVGGVTAFIELKAPDNLTGKSGTRQDQAVWVWRWARAGGHAFVLVAWGGSPDPQDWFAYFPGTGQNWPREMVAGRAPGVRVWDVSTLLRMVREPRRYRLSEAQDTNPKNRPGTDSIPIAEGTRVRVGSGPDAWVGVVTTRASVVVALPGLAYVKADAGRGVYPVPLHSLTVL